MLYRKIKAGTEMIKSDRILGERKECLNGIENDSSKKKLDGMIKRVGKG